MIKLNNIAKTITTTVVTLALLSLSGCNNDHDQNNSTVHDDRVEMYVNHREMRATLYPTTHRPPNGEEWALAKDIERVKQHLGDAGVQTTVLGCIFPQLPSQEKIPPETEEKTGFGPNLDIFVFWSVPRSQIVAAEKSRLSVLDRSRDQAYGSGSLPFVPCDFDAWIRAVSEAQSSSRLDAK